MGGDGQISPGAIGAIDLSTIATRQDFAAALTTLRERAGLTVREVARSINTPPSTVGGYFVGRHLPPLAQLDQFVELLRVCGVHDQAEIDRWLAVVAALRRVPGPRQAGAPAPYRGLAQFDVADSEWFFGRERLVERLLERLGGGARVLAVVGPSGCGKSSLLRAGLVPAVEAGAPPLPDGQPWRVLVTTPGTRPLDALARAVAEGGGLPVEQVVAACRAGTWPDFLAAGGDETGGDETGGDETGGAVPAGAPAGSGTAVPAPADHGDRSRGEAEPAREGRRLLLVLDQFEEVFAPEVPEAERAACAAALAWLAGGGDRRGAAVWAVVVGMRADFYEAALRYPTLASILQQSQLVVEPMTGAELRRAITEPARKAQLELEPGLLELLLAEMAAPGSAADGAAHDPGALPLLSHALWSTWQRRSRNRLTVAAYRDSGGIRGAVAATAEELYLALTPRQRQLTKRLFLRLVRVADEGPETRRRSSRDELSWGGEELHELLEQFIDRRLITAEAERVEITHEALLVAWPRLREWIDGDRAGLRIHRRLTAAAEQWRDEGRQPDALYRGASLAAVREWAAEPETGVALSELERQFLAAAVDRDTAELRAGRRRGRVLQLLLVGVSVLAVLAVSFAGYAVRQRGEARQQRDLAISRQLAGAAEQLRATSPGLAEQLALAAYRTAPTPEARSSLVDSYTGPVVTRLTGTKGITQAVAVDRAHQLIAAAGADETVRLWRRGDDGRFHRGGTVGGHDATIFALAIDPRGQLLASGGADGSVRLWRLDAGGGAAPAGPPLAVGAETVYSVAFSPDGRQLAAGASDGRVVLWQVGGVAAPRRLATVPAPSPRAAARSVAAQSVAYGPGGKTLVTGYADGTVRLWKVSDPRHPAALGAALTGPKKAVFAVAISPDATMLAAGSADSSVWLWRLRGTTATPAGQLSQPGSWVNSVSFSPDGQRLAAGSSDGKAWLWHVTSRDLAATLPHPGPVTSVVFDGSSLVTAAADGVVRSWQLPGAVLTGPPDDVFAVNFTTLRHRIAMVDRQHDVATIWDTTDPRAPRRIVAIPHASGADGASGASAISPDGTTLAVASSDGTGAAANTVQLWDVRDPAHPVPAGPRLRGPAALIQSLRFTADGTVLAAGSNDKRVWLWDMRMPRRPVDGSPLTGHTNYVFGVAFTSDGQLVAAGSADGAVRLWRREGTRWRPVATPLTGHTSYVYAVAFSPDSRLLATAGADNTVRLWDVSDPEAPRQVGAAITGPTNYVYELSFDASGARLAAAGGDGRVWLWDVSAPERPRLFASLSGYGGAVYTVAFDPAQEVVAAGGDQGTVRLWSTDPEVVAAAVCGSVGDPITPAEWRRYATGVPYRAPCGTG